MTADSRAPVRLQVINITPSVRHTATSEHTDQIRGEDQNQAMSAAEGTAQDNEKNSKIKVTRLTDDPHVRVGLC